MAPRVQSLDPATGPAPAPSVRSAQFGGDPAGPYPSGSGAEQVVDERDGIAEVGDDGIGADAQQPPALPRVDPAGAVMRLVAGDGHRQAADLLGVLDLDVTVAERDELPAGDPVRADDAVDHQLLGELLVVVEGPVDVAAEITG